MKLDNLKLLLFGRFVSSIGDQFYYVAISSAVFMMTGSALATGAIFAVKGVVHLLGLFYYRPLSLAGQKKLVMFSDFVRSILVLALIPALSSGTILWIYVIVFFLEAIQVAYSPGRVVLVNNASDNRKLNNTADQITSMAAMVIGLSLGGIVTYYYSPETAIALDGLSFLIAGIVTVFVTVADKQETQVKEKNTTKPFQWIQNQKKSDIKSFLTLYPILYLPIIGFNSLLVVFVLDTLQSTEAVYGYFEGAMGVGLLLGSLLALKVKPEHRLNIIYSCLGIQTIFYGLVTSSENLIYIGTFLALSSVANILYSTSHRCLIADHFSDSEDLAMAWLIFRSSNILYGSLGAITFGLIAQKIGIRESFFYSVAALALGIVIFVIIQTKKRRSHDNIIQQA